MTQQHLTCYTLKAKAQTCIGQIIFIFFLLYAFVFVLFFCVFFPSIKTSLFCFSRSNLTIYLLNIIPTWFSNFLTQEWRWYNTFHSSGTIGIQKWSKLYIRKLYYLTLCHRQQNRVFRWASTSYDHIHSLIFVQGLVVMFDIIIIRGTKNLEWTF